LFPRATIARTFEEKNKKNKRLMKKVLHVYIQPSNTSSALPLVDLYLISEKSIWKNQVR
jgi:hypothetical protein